MHDELKNPADSEGTTGMSARRKLISGAFAAPVALTLHSGSALAATSLSCVNRQNTNFVRTPGDTVTGTWVRVPIWELTVNGANNDSAWISGADIFAYAKTGTTTFISASQWFCLSAESKATVIQGTKEIEVVAQGTYTLNPSPPQSGNGGSLVRASPNQSRLIAIRVDASGNIIGVVDVDASAGSAVTESCWSSFRA